MKLLFVRHGDPDYDRDCLTELGKKEASALAVRMKNTKMDAVFTSPLGRAKETAQRALSGCYIVDETCDWLREFDAPVYRPDAGGSLTITWDWLPSDWTGIDEFYSIDTWLNAECMTKTHVEREYNRVCGELDKVLAHYGYERNGRLYRVKEANTKTLVFFCHYGVTCVLLSHILSISPMILWHGTVAACASVTELATEERREGIAAFRMNHYGDTSHLEAAGLPMNPCARFTEIYSDMTQRHD